MSRAPIRVLIADSDPLVFADLRSALGRRSDIEIFNAAVDGNEAIEKLLQLNPDIVLIDLNLRRTERLTMLRSIKIQAPRSKIIVLESFDGVNNLVEALRLGCFGVLLKGAPTSFVERCIRRAHAGEIWIDPITTAAFHQFAYSDAAGSSARESRMGAQPSRRERELIFLIAQGFNNKQIAAKLLISVQTVKNHLHHVFEKLGVSDRLELALYAVHDPSLTLNPELHRSYTDDRSSTHAALACDEISKAF